jgi:DNA-binding transcriptional ArsR family regulator
MPRSKLNPKINVDRILHALGDPTRRAIVERLSRAGPQSVSHLAKPLAITITAVAQHLQILEQGALVRTEKIGRTRTCSLQMSGLAALEQWITYQRSEWENRLDRLGDLLAEDDEDA